MSITLDLPPAMVQKANDLAESRNATLSQLFIGFIDSELKREREAAEWMARLDAMVKKSGVRLTGMSSPMSPSRNFQCRKTRLARMLENSCK